MVSFAVSVICVCTVGIAGIASTVAVWRLYAGLVRRLRVALADKADEIACLERFVEMLKSRNLELVAEIDRRA